MILTKKDTAGLMTRFLKATVVGMGIFLGVLVGLFALFIWGTPSACDDLIDAGRGTDLPQRLELWANENVFSQKLTADDIRPAHYRQGGRWEFVGATFPWETIGFLADPNYAKVRFIVRGRDWLEQGDLNDYDAIGFSDRSYEGYLVKKQGASGFGITPNFNNEIYALSENVAVLCISK